MCIAPRLTRTHIILPAIVTAIVTDRIHLLVFYIDLAISPNFAYLRYTAPTFRSIL